MNTVTLNENMSLDRKKHRSEMSLATIYRVWPLFGTGYTDEYSLSGPSLATVIVECYSRLSPDYH